MADEKALNVRIPTELKNKFTRAARDEFGEEPGALKKATIKAIKMWMESKEVHSK